MSTAHPSPSESHRQTDECARDTCSVEFDIQNAADGSYCSQKCAITSRGASVLETIANDHQRCRTCFARLKTVDPVPLRIKERLGEDCATGIQARTPRATTGLQTVPGEERWLDQDQLGTICECGATNHSQYEPVFNAQDLRERTENLLGALDQLHEDGLLPHKPTKEVVVRNVHCQGEIRWAWAIGLGLKDAAES